MPTKQDRTDDGRLTYVFTDDEDQPVELINRFLLYTLNRGSSPNTVRAYSNDLQYLVRFLRESDLSIADIRSRHMPDFLDYLRSRASRTARAAHGQSPNGRTGGRVVRQLSPASASRALAAVAMFYDFLITYEQYDHQHPLQTVESPVSRLAERRPRPALGASSKQGPVRRRTSVKVPERLPRPMRREDVEHLVESFTKLRDKALTLLLVNGGLRPSEALTLDLSDIQYGLRRVRVRVVHDDPRGLRTKSTQERTVDLHDGVTLAAISSYVMHERPRESGSTLLFLVGGNGQRRLEPLSYSAVNRTFARRCEALGIRTPWTTLHALRHTHATEMFEHGMRDMTLQKRLGHKSLQSTKIYTKVSDPTVLHDYQAAIESQRRRDNS